MAINVTLPIAEPTNITTTVQAGGDLEPSTTYYYVMIAWSNRVIHCSALGVVPYHSPISVEGSFTTTADNKSAKFNWTNGVGHTSATRYEILISKVSGDYTDSNSVGTKTNIETLGDDLTDGTTGFTVTELKTGNTENYVIHSCQLANPFVFDVDRDLGIINVDLDGGTNTIEDIHTAIVNAGLGDYVYYDGYNFILKGFITTSGTTAGLTHITRKNIVLLRGGFQHFNNPNYIVRFGTWTNDVRGADQTQGCHIDIHGSRWAIRADSEGALQIYGSHITANRVKVSTETQIVHDEAYSDPLVARDVMIRGRVSEFRQNIIAITFRDYFGDVYDILSFLANNNFGAGTHYRINVIQSANLPYTALTRFYEVAWLHAGSTLTRWLGVAGHWGLQSYFYNNRFPTSDNLPGEVRFSVPPTSGETITAALHFYWEMKIIVLDEDGDPIEDADILLKDKDEADGEWVEFEDTIDKDVTGTTYTGTIKTDANGEVNHYVLSTRYTLDPNYVGGSGSTTAYTITTHSYPYTITISKKGFETQTVYLETFTDKFESTVVLKKAIQVMTSNKGPAIKANPENSGDNRDLLIMP